MVVIINQIKIRTFETLMIINRKINCFKEILIFFRNKILEFSEYL
jgi:hypothetical protein